jgi:hypothetical protein
MDVATLHGSYNPVNAPLAFIPLPRRLLADLKVRTTNTKSSANLQVRQTRDDH